MGPMVSVVIPLHNGRATIKQAIDSVFSQTYKSRELIVVDDGSTDSGKEIVQQYGSGVHLLEEANAGTTAARNCGAKHASGRYLAFLDQDDWWIPKKLEMQVKFLEKQPSTGLVFGNLFAVDPDGKTLGFLTNDELSRHSPSLQELLLIFPLYPSSATLRKDLFDATGGFDTRFGLSGAYGDQDFHIRLRKLAPFQFIDTAVGFYRWEEKRQRRIRNFLANLPIFADKYYHSSLVASGGRRLQERFVQKCADNLNYMGKWLLRANGNLASPQLLAEMNEYHDQLKVIFGKAYLQVAGQDSLRLDKYLLNLPTSTLLFVFLCRQDLQADFPEVFRGDLSRLVEWGHDVAAGVRKDVDHETLYKLGPSLVLAESPKLTYENEFSKRTSYLVGGDGVEHKDRIEQKLRNLLSAKEKTIDEVDYQYRVAISELRRIECSLGYRIMKAASFRIDRAFPSGTVRGGLRMTAMIGIRTMADEGFRTFLAKATQKLRRRKFLSEK